MTAAETCRLEKLVGWAMDDGGVLFEWAWYRNAVYLCRLLMGSHAANPLVRQRSALVTFKRISWPTKAERWFCKVDRTVMHQSAHTNLKFSIQKSLWPCGINTKIVLDIKGFKGEKTVEMGAPEPLGRADPKLYGIKSSETSSVSEDDVLHTPTLQNFEHSLNDQEAEQVKASRCSPTSPEIAAPFFGLVTDSLEDRGSFQLFTALVCPYVRVPLLVNFFDKNRLTTLCRWAVAYSYNPYGESLLQL